MIPLELPNNCFSIQKCLIPDSEFLNLHYGRFVLIRSVDCDWVCKIRLCEPTNLHNIVYFDRSVVIPKREKQVLTVRTRLFDIGWTNFVALPHPKVAEEIKITLIVRELNPVNSSILKSVLKNILKVFVFKKKSHIFLNSLSAVQNFGIFCIIVNEVGSRDECDNLYRISKKTDIYIEKCVSMRKYEQGLKINSPLGGFYDIIKELEDVMQYNADPDCHLTRHVLIIGSAGCGKKSVLYKVAQQCDYVVIRVTSSDIYEALPGETEKKLRNLFELGAKHQNIGEKCVLLLENVDSIGMKTDDGSSHSKRVLLQLLELIENSPVMVVATSRSMDEVDNRLAKCFHHVIEIHIPNAQERVGILTALVQHHAVDCPHSLLQEVAEWMPGYVAADIQMVAYEALQMFSKETDKNQNLESCWRKAISKFVPSSLRGAVGFITKARTTTFADIGGLGEVIKQLNHIVKLQLLYPETFQRFNIPRTKGILLYGPPGCAKTSLVRALANETNTTFLAVSAADLYSPFVGDAEHKIIQLFAQARMGAPSIVFIDEIDALVGSKTGNRHRGVQERVLSALLIEMDGVGLRTATVRTDEGKINPKDVIVIGATNRPDMLDDALKRPGRFDKLLYVPAPNVTERLDILKTITRNMPLGKNVKLDVIAENTKMFSGADLRMVCVESALNALTTRGMGVFNIEASDFNTVLKTFRSSLMREHSLMFNQI